MGSDGYLVVLQIYERHHHQHRPHRALASAALVRALPSGLEPPQGERLNIRRRDRPGGVLPEYQHAV
ncbi:integrase [Streptacidiphilus pinicola]|uniref:Integrase n=1 Tax=Streptacidiphilus pinicola TaxID=2219663 RepID=A0A2X0ICX2_9ACTN|nr:integrase [Streptacidiphilus pinicola]